MPHVSTIDFRVRYAETDQMGVVYHANYLVWCELGRTEFIRTLGVTYAELERQGVQLAVSEASIRFHAGARYDDMIRVSTTLAGVRSRMVTFDYDVSIRDTGECPCEPAEQLLRRAAVGVGLADRPGHRLEQGDQQLHRGSGL